MPKDMPRPKTNQPLRYLPLKLNGNTLAVLIYLELLNNYNSRAGGSNVSLVNPAYFCRIRRIEPSKTYPSEPTKSNVDEVWQCASRALKSIKFL